MFCHLSTYLIEIALTMAGGNCARARNAGTTGVSVLVSSGRQSSVDTNPDGTIIRQFVYGEAGTRVLVNPGCYSSLSA